MIIHDVISQTFGGGNNEKTLSMSLCNVHTAHIAFLVGGLGLHLSRVGSNRSLGVEPEHETVGIWVYNLLRDVEVGQFLHGAQKGDVSLTQLKNGSGLDVPVKQPFRHQSPRLDVSHLSFTLKESKDRYH